MSFEVLNAMLLKEATWWPPYPGFPRSGDILGIERHELYVESVRKVLSKQSCSSERRTNLADEKEMSRGYTATSLAPATFSFGCEVWLWLSSCAPPREPSDDAERVGPIAVPSPDVDPHDQQAPAALAFHLAAP
jgi:hypothetical protein